MNRRMLPAINFKAYRKPKFLIACYQEWGVGVLFNGGHFKRAECPLCTPEGERSRCCSWSFETCSFYCHKCRARGDALQLVMLRLSCSVIEAAKWLEQKAGPAGSGLVVSTEDA